MLFSICDADLCIVPYWSLLVASSLLFTQLAAFCCQLMIVMIEKVMIEYSGLYRSENNQETSLLNTLLSQDNFIANRISEKVGCPGTIR